MSNIVFNESGTVGYMPGAQAALLTNIKIPATPKPRKPTKSEPKQDVDGYGDVSPWGDDNLFPQNVIKDCEPNTIIPQTLEKQARILQSGGLMYGNFEGYDESGNEKFTPVFDPNVETWMKQAKIKRYLREASSSFYWFYNLFPELILSKNRQQIVGIYNKRPEWARWSKTLDDLNFSKYCYLNADWEWANSEASERTIKIESINPYFEPEFFLRSGKKWNYIFPVSYPSPDRAFYQLAPWNAVRTSGWLDVARSIPTFKKSLFKNQITVKYLIKVSTWWWNWAYPGFDKLSAEKKKDIIDEEAKNFQDFMLGDDKAGNSIITSYQSDPQLQKKYDGWEIDPIDNKIKDGIYIEDSREASSHLLYAIGVDPTLLGSLPGKDFGAGSGSDKRVAYNIYLSMIEPHRDVILEPIQFAFEYNGFPYKVKFRNTKIITLDKGADTQTNVA